MERRELLKPSRVLKSEKRRILNSEMLKNRRSLRRTQYFNLRRDDIEDVVNENIVENIPPRPRDQRDTVKDRKLALQRFKAEKEAQKRALLEKKKPPFVVGIPHHGSSPLLRNFKLPAENINKKFNFQTNKVAQSEKKLTSPHTPTVLKRSAQKKPLANMTNLNKLKTSPGRTHIDEDEVLAAPLKPEESKTQKRPVSRRKIASKEINKPCNVTKEEQSPDEGVDKEDEVHNRKPSSPVDAQQSGPNEDLRRSLRKSSEQHEVKRESVADETAAEINKPCNETKEEQSADEGFEKKDEVHNRKSSSPVDAQQSDQNEDLRRSLRKSTEQPEVKESVADETAESDEDKERATVVAFQLGRLETESGRLLALADHWQAEALQVSLPREVEDEVDSVVGQTRLLTRDKFNQFRRLVEQYDRKTGTHPITLDDLNGFWEMMYLQVESLEKKYSALDILKTNNWVKPEPAGKKKRRPAKKQLKNKTPQAKEEMAHSTEAIGTPRTEAEPVIISAFLQRKIRTRSNSPSPYIAMRLSGVGRTPSNAVQPRDLSMTPLSTLKGSLTPSSSVDVKIEVCDVEPEPAQVTVTEPSPASDDLPKRTPRRSNLMVPKFMEIPDIGETASNEELPVITPRRSTRLMEKARTSVYPTPKSCSTCLAPSHSETTGCSNGSARKSTKKKLAFSPLADQQSSELATVPELTQPKETNLNKPSTCRSRFSLRPSILTVVNDIDMSEKPKKVNKRKLSSVASSSTMIVNEEAEELVNKAEVQCRRSSRKSRRVTFDFGSPEAGAKEEKRRFKLPATPFRRIQNDSE